jgi:hypothetical protein
VKEIEANELERELGDLLAEFILKKQKERASYYSYAGLNYAKIWQIFIFHHTKR